MLYLGMMKTRVVNVRYEKCDVYCGRPSILGNPFKIGRDGNRDEVIRKFIAYFKHRILTDTAFKAYVDSLDGLRIGCWCKPKPCHLDIVAEYLNGCMDSKS